MEKKKAELNLPFLAFVHFIVIKVYNKYNPNFFKQGQKLKYINLKKYK